ncbi:3633_t:CDS:1, partial [Cetraspora pellucida]
FTKDKTIGNNEELYEIVQGATTLHLEQLPDDPNQISENITQILLFDLPIKQRDYTKAVAAALHRIYRFDKLPEAYFTLLGTLPNRIADLNPEIKHLFLIIER